MKMTKSQGISCAIMIVVFVVLSIILFILPVEKKITFWMGYVFMAYAFIVILIAHFKFFSKQVKEERFLNIPVVTLSWVYLVAQCALSFFEITKQLMSYTGTLILNLIVALIFTVLILAVSASSNKIDKNTEKVINKVLFKDTINNELKMLDTDDLELKKKIDNLIDDVTYSDPMSHSQLADLENDILQKTKELSANIADTERAISICDEISKLLKNRNNQCLTLKKVKDTADAETSGGGKIAVLGIGIALVIVLAVTTVIVYVISESQYKEACELMDTSKYDEAIVAFENLDDYKDSKDKIEKIKEILYVEKYNKAEAAFSAGNYDEALKLYTEVIAYKDSKDKIIEIKNRQSSNDIMYLGFYNDEPIAWRMVEFQGYDKALLLADQAIRNLPISDDIADVSYDNSEIAKWLSSDFLNDFTDRDLSKIIETDGYKVFLLGEGDVNRLKYSGTNIASDSDWWIRTETKKGFKYVTKDGNIADAGDIHLRDKGVRPALWINLK